MGNREKRFPLISVIVVVLLAAGVGGLTHFWDQSTPRKALGQVGQAISGLGDSLVMMARASGDFFVFSSQEDNGASTYNTLPLLVNAENPVPADYVPEDLVRMREYCDPAIVTIKGSEIDGNRQAVDALMIMLRSAIDEGVTNWQVSAGYRSVAYQQQLWDNRVYEYRQDGLSGEQAQTATAKYVAVPGASEHHTGLAFDITVPGESFPLTDQSKWLAANCWDYGFIIRYTEDKIDLTGINAEPWHVRYVGEPHAKRMQENNWCLEEYIAQAGG